MSNHKYLLKQYNNDRIKKQKIERLISIMKGLLVYKEETEELRRLISKYPEQLQNFNIPYA